MQVMYPRCACLDVYKETVVACVRLLVASGVVTGVRTFATAAGLLALAGCCRMAARMWRWRRLVYCVWLALLMLTGSAIAQPATMTWPEAVAQLTGERAKAETCVALVKRYGDDAQKARAQLTYTNAKADADAVIAGLTTALSAGQEPASLSSLQARLSNGVSGLAEFCGTVANLLASTAGQKSIATNNNHRTDDALTRRTIQTQLEAAKWPDFADVKPAPMVDMPRAKASLPRGG